MVNKVILLHIVGEPGTPWIPPLLSLPDKVLQTLRLNQLPAPIALLPLHHQPMCCLTPWVCLHAGFACNFLFYSCF